MSSIVGIIVMQIDYVIFQDMQQVPYVLNDEMMMYANQRQIYIPAVAFAMFLSPPSSPPT